MMDCMESDIVLACAENSSFMRSIACMEMLSNIWIIEQNSSANTKKAALNAISLENSLEENGEKDWCVLVFER